MTGLNVCSTWKTTLFHYCQWSWEHKTVLFSAKIILHTGLMWTLGDKNSNTAGLQKNSVKLLKMPSLKYGTCEDSVVIVGVLHAGRV